MYFFCIVLSQEIILFIRINNLSNKRKRNLEVAKTYYQFLQDAEEEERWVDEKIGVVKQTAIGKDLNAACVLLKRHEVDVSTFLLS